MTDLVERLQMLQSLLGDPRPRNTVRDAIAEIERLRAALAAERERCVNAVRGCLYLDWEGGVLSFGPVTEANAEILRCVESISEGAQTP